MSKINLDLSQFKHVKTEKGMTTLRHKAGHELKLAHSSLSPDNQKQLAALSKIAKDTETPLQADSQKHNQMAKGGDVLDSGTKRGVSTQGQDVRNSRLAKETKVVDHKPHDKQAREEAAGRAEMERHNKPKIKGLADGGEAKPIERTDPDKAAAAQKGVQQATPSMSDVYHNVMKGVGLEADPNYDKEHKAAGGEVKHMAKGGLPSEHNLAEQISSTHPTSADHYAYDANLPCLNPHCKSYGHSHPNCRCYNGGESFAEGGEAKKEYYCDSERKHFSNCEYANGGVAHYADPQAPVSKDDVEEITPPQFMGKPGQEQHGRGAQHQYMVEPNQNTLDAQKRKDVMDDVEGSEAWQQRQGSTEAAPLHGASGAWDDVKTPQVPPQQEQAIEPSTQLQPDAMVAPPQSLPGPAATGMGSQAVESNPIQRFANQTQETAQGIKNDLTQEQQAWKNDLANGHITPLTYNDLWAKNPDGSSKGSLAKIGGLFALMLSGAGSGLSHQPNMYMQMMDKIIDNDLNAQKQSKQNAISHLTLAQQHELNRAGIGKTNTETDTLALANAKARKRYDALDHLYRAGQSLPEQTPQQQQAKQQYMTALGLMATQADMANDSMNGIISSNIALQKANNPIAGETPEEALQRRQHTAALSGNPRLKAASDLETAEHYPAISGVVGHASQELTPDDRNHIEAGTEFQQKLDRMIDWAKKHPGVLPITPKNYATIKEGKTLAAELQGAYRQATHGGVYKEGEQNFISKLIDEDPTRIMNDVRVIPQLTALSRENSNRIRSKVRSLGFKDYQPATHTQQQPQTPIAEGSTSMSGTTPIIYRGGKWVPQ